MKINYNRLFNLVIGHDYFSDGYDRFIRLSPTSETALLLKNGQMLFKRLPHGITVLYRATDDEITPQVTLEGEQHFVFILQSDSLSALLNISGFDDSTGKKYRSGNLLYFTNDPANASVNSGNPEIITHQLIDSIRAKLFTFSFSVTGNPATVQMQVINGQGVPVSIGTNPDGTPFPTTLTLKTGSNNTFTQQVDLRGKRSGRYTIKIKNSTGATVLLQEEIYADDELSGRNILGIAGIRYTPATGHLYGDTEEYLLQFRRAETRWKYFVVNKNAHIDFETGSVIINDTGSSNGSPYITNQFDRAYAGMLLKAKTAGTAGNNITLGYSGGGAYPALQLSGKTLTGGTASDKAQAIITVINNTVTGYTVRVNGINLTEGSQFNNGATPAATAGNIVAAINANGGTQVTATVTGYDMKIQGRPALVFVSGNRIPFFEKPKTGIRLLKSSDNQEIVSDLPNPPHKGIQKTFAGEPESEIFVFI